MHRIDLAATDIRPAALRYRNGSGAVSFVPLTHHTSDKVQRLAAIVRRCVAKGTWSNASVVWGDGQTRGLDSIPEPAATPPVYLVAHMAPAGRRAVHVPADRIGHVSQLRAESARRGAAWDIEAHHQDGRDAIGDIEAFRRIPAFCA